MIATHTEVSLQDLVCLPSTETLIITVNNRYARRILAELSSRLDDARRVIAVPDIVPLSAWLRQAGDQLSFMPEAQLAGNTLDTFGSRHLWQQVIGEAEAEDRLLDVAEAACLAAEADHLLDEWQIRVGPEHATVDYQRFAGWRERYRAAQRERDLEDSNLTYERIRHALAQGQLALPFSTLVLAGFHELSPRFSAVVRSMEEQGIKILRLAHAQQPAAEIRRVAVPDPDAEWRQAAQWAACQLKLNPAGRYAIVAARLEADLVLAHRTLHMELGLDENRRPVPYNVALARPLAQWPLVRAALAWLHVLSEFSRRRYCAPADLGQALLAGGCLGHVSEASGRAMMDALWRQQAKVSVNLSEFVLLLQRYAPRLATVWAPDKTRLDEYAGSKTIDHWVDALRKWLETLEFPGRGSLHSHEYQVMEALDELLGRLGRQAAVVGRVSIATAVAMLARLARETAFQPQRDPAARLDVLGFLEAEGGRWDGLWVLGLTDEVLPAAPRPNPFIPVAALRHANAPRATPERELQWAQTLYTSLLACAPSVRLSHALHEGERLLRPSPCIAHLPITESEADISEPPACVLEYVIDEQGPTLQAGSATRGGIGVLDTQARNPLWAFVKYRLGASQLKDYADLANQNARGLFLHRAIELVWRQLEDYQALQELHDNGRLDELTQPCVEEAAQECLQDYGKMWRQLETERAMRVVRELLTLERSRQPFRVRDVEQTYDWSHGALNLSLRLDRIDELSDGRLAVLDYKTGIGNIDPRSDWMRTRPIGLQLPFYASVLATDADAVAALVLVKLHARAIETKGLTDAELGLTGISAVQDWPAFAHVTWAGLMSQWRRTIEGLAQEFCAGDARNVSLRADDIAYCDVLPFLRLNEEFPRDR